MLHITYIYIHTYIKAEKIENIVIKYNKRVKKRGKLNDGRKRKVKKND